MLARERKTKMKLIEYDFAAPYACLWLLGLVCITWRTGEFWTTIEIEWRPI